MESRESHLQRHKKALVMWSKGENITAHLAEVEGQRLSWSSPLSWRVECWEGPLAGGPEHTPASARSPRHSSGSVRYMPQVM